MLDGLAVALAWGEFVALLAVLLYLVLRDTNKRPEQERDRTPH
jgi:hypothetical protein